MRTTIKEMSGERRKAVVWIFETEGGGFIGGGHCAEIEAARRDAAKWLTGKAVRVKCDCHWADDDDQPRVTVGPCDGVVTGVDFRDTAVIIHVALHSGGYFLYEREADGDVLHVL